MSTPATTEEVAKLTPDWIVKAGDLGYRGMDAVEAAVRLKRGEIVSQLNRGQRREQIRKMRREMV